MMPGWTPRRRRRTPGSCCTKNLDDDLEFYRVGREVNTSAKDRQPYDLPSMIEPSRSCDDWSSEFCARYQKSESAMSNFNETSFGFFIFLLRTAHQHYSPTELLPHRSGYFLFTQV
jgi:hypothetical protein